MSISQPPSTASNPFALRFDSLLRSEPGLAELRRAAEELRDDAPVLRDALLVLARNDRDVAAVARRSSVHANGFAKIVLHVTGTDGPSVRLHVWHRRNGRWVPETAPHGHRWEFASWIVVGALRETTFVEAPAGREYMRLAYGRHPGGGGYLRGNGQASLRSDLWLPHPEGTVYTRKRSVIHTVDPHGDGLVASIVLQSPRGPDPTQVYVRRGSPRDHDEWPLSHSEVRDRLIEVAGAIR